MAVFGNLAEKLQETFKRLSNKGKLTEADVKAAMREVRIALLEADVSYKVVKDFIAKVTERAVGGDVLESLTPGQQVIKIVNEELIELMGSENAKIQTAKHPPTVVMMVGLQGTGKTTSTAKIANFLKKQKRRPLMVAADIYRPAAIKQLQVLGEQLDLPVFAPGADVSPVEIARTAKEHALKFGNDFVLIDTAGRLHIDEGLMQELKDIREVTEANEILLVVDAMAGNYAIKVAESFNEELGIDGLVLTKMDGDTRGGAALSAKAVTGKPVKFVGMGEKLDAMEPFHPERMASRILGMGDMLSLIEKAQEAFDQEKAQELEESMRSNQFTLDDFLGALEQVRKMGGVKDLLSMMPGGIAAQMKDVQVDDREMARIEAIVKSMTKAERRDPKIINGSRKQRIAKGSGNQVQHVNRLLKQFGDMQKLMKKFSAMQEGKAERVHKPRDKKGKKKGKKQRFGGMGLPGMGGGMPNFGDINELRKFLK